VPDQDEIQSQQQLLAQHRQTLRVLLHQVATLGKAHSPPGIINGIDEARKNIWKIKATLQGWGVSVADYPDDEEAQSITPPPPRQWSIMGRGATLIGTGLFAIISGLAIWGLVRLSPSSTNISQASPMPVLTRGLDATALPKDVSSSIPITPNPTSLVIHQSNPSTQLPTERGPSTPTSIAIGATIVLSPIPSSCSPQPVNPNNDATYYYQHGQDYYQKGLDYQRQGDKEYAKSAFGCAIDYFTDAIALKDKYIEAIQYRALAYYAKGNYDSAIEDYTQAINLAPNDKQKAVYHYHRGGNYYLKGRDLCNGNSECTSSAYKAAIEDYTTTIHAVPNCVDAYAQRAFVYRQRNEEGDADRAIADDEQASKLKEVSVPCSN